MLVRAQFTDGGPKRARHCTLREWLTNLLCRRIGYLKTNVGAFEVLTRRYIYGYETAIVCPCGELHLFGLTRCDVEAKQNHDDAIDYCIHETHKSEEKTK